MKMRLKTSGARLRSRMLPGIVTLALAGLASAQDAAPIVYDVELIVFQQLNPGGTPEDWKLEEELAAREQPVVTAEEEGPIAASSAPVLGASGPARQVLPREKFKLTAIAASLQRSRSYRPLAHFGWSQVGTPLNGTVPMPLGDLLPTGTLTGSAALARGRFLHLTLDLGFRPEGEPQQYVLRQTRRMRSNERHYIDHPQFGVIALVTPQTP
jgi:Peptidoglycan-binding protein, CsiV